MKGTAFSNIMKNEVVVMFELKFNHNLQNIWVTRVALGNMSNEERLKAFISMLLKAADKYEKQLNALDADGKFDEKLVVFKVLDKTGGRQGKPLGEVRIKMDRKEIALISRRLFFTCEMIGCTGLDVKQAMIAEQVNVSMEKVAHSKRSSGCVKLTFDKNDEERALQWDSGEIEIYGEPKKVENAAE